MFKPYWKMSTSSIERRGTHTCLRVNAGSALRFGGVFSWIGGWSTSDILEQTRASVFQCGIRSRPLVPRKGAFQSKLDLGARLPRLRWTCGEHGWQSTDGYGIYLVIPFSKQEVHPKHLDSSRRNHSQLSF